MEGYAAAVPAFDPRALPAGTRLGKYEVIERLAVGGMAELYLARVSGILEKLVVIKRVHPHLATDAGFVRMFLNEARLAATLDHPNVTSVMDFGVADGEYFFTMEYLHGEDLREILSHAAPDGGLPPECAVEVVRGVARGLHHAHERVGSDGRPLGLVHRDVSPSNVFVTYEGGVKVVDFGIAKAAAMTKQTTAGTLKGKVGYMSPEQCRGDPVDRRSDVFALGILLYETTTGKRLFYAESQYAVLNKIIEGRYAPPSALVSDYPEELETIVRRALAVDPDDRHPTAEALQLALEDFAREAQLRCSPHVLAGYLEGLVGHRPYPTPEIPGAERPVRTGGTAPSDEEAPTEPALRSAPTVVALPPGPPLDAIGPEYTPPRSRSVLAYVLVGGVALAAGLGVGGVLRSDSGPEVADEVAPEPAAGEPEPAAAKVASPDEVSPDEASLDEASLDEAAATQGAAAPENSADALDFEADAAAEPDPSEAEDEPTDRSRKRRRRTKSRGKSKASQEGGKSLYPPSYYDE